MARKSKKKKAAKKKPKAKSQQPKAKKPKAKKVWHIFHFAERFELPAAMQVCRRGPLQFLKLPVAGDPYDNESHILVGQWAMLDREDDTLVLEAVLIRLWKHAARRSRKFRGYILNEHYAPATTLQISRIVKLDVSRTARVLKVLAKYNLIERVAMPAFDAIPDEPDPPWRGEKDKGQKPKKTDGDGAGGGDAKVAAPAASLDLDKIYDPECKEFAGEVFVKIFGRAAKAGVLADHREVGAFANAWCRAQTAGLKPSQLQTLWDKSIKEADKTGRANRLGRAKKPGAVWMKIFNGRLAGMQNGK